ncbi:hypothetical protein [Fibrella forsythiae]|uniref:Uncharacterized protein n=1 Tax=Fibrella forsythiae TaxID=2817061 RepID=A0ABS3JRA4_9BACT|nr:hypothetical protein [Fibrella forsythiae]MBO0952523.1 hypothetical protein [Fibrella forsythiae]
MLGGGDELALLKQLISRPWLGHCLGLALSAVLAIPPLLRAYHALPISNRQGVFWALAILSLLLEWALAFQGLNRLLAHGIGSAAGLLGMPLLVTLWTGTTGLLLLICGRWLTGLFYTFPTAADA